MSKIGSLNLEIQEQAEEFGFETTDEALQNGFTVDYENQTLRPPRKFNSTLEELECELSNAEWEQEKLAKHITELNLTIKEIKGE